MQCDSLVNYVTPVHTAAGGTGSVSAAESAKLGSTIYMGLLSVSLSSKKTLKYKTGCVNAGHSFVAVQFPSRAIVAF